MSQAVIGRIPLDDDRNPVLGGLSNADGQTAIPAYIDSATNAVLVKVASGGSGGTQYQELATTSPATGTVALGRYSSTPPTLTNGQLDGLQLDSSGNLKVNAAAMSGTTDSVAINDGTNTANVKSIASGNNALAVAPGFLEQVSLTSGSLNTDLIPSFDVSSYNEIALQITGTWSGTLTTQFSNDNTNFASYSSTTGSGAGAGNTMTSNGIYRIVPMGRYMRVRMTAYTSGTANGVAEFYTMSGRPTLSAQYTVSQTGTWTVGATSDYPAGATAITAASGNVANASAAASLAGTSGKTTYITGFEITSAGATVGLVVNPTITGTITGTLTYAYAAPAGALIMGTPLVVEFPKPIPASATNTAIVVTLPALGTGNTNATVVAHGYQL